MDRQEKIQAALRVVLPDEPIISSQCQGALDPKKGFGEEGKPSDHGWCMNSNYEECHCQCPCHWSEKKLLATALLSLSSGQRREIIDRLASIYFGGPDIDPKRQRRAISRYSLAELLNNEISLY